MPSPIASGISGTAIAGDITQYIGHQYVLGGAPGRSGLNPWDCSSCVNWVLGHDFNMRLPGMVRPGYSGVVHGPVVTSYATWTGAKTVPSPQAGDLCIWVGVGIFGHIGIAVSPQKMISALNPALGTAETPIRGSGPLGAPLIFRRVTGVAGTNLSGCLTPQPVAALIVKAWKL